MDADVDGTIGLDGTLRGECDGSRPSGIVECGGWRGVVGSGPEEVRRLIAIGIAVIAMEGFVFDGLDRVAIVDPDRLVLSESVSSMVQIGARGTFYRSI